MLDYTSVEVNFVDKTIVEIKQDQDHRLFLVVLLPIYLITGHLIVYYRGAFINETNLATKGGNFLVSVSLIHT